ncbi:MAG: alpha-mannosidase [Prochlorococcus sp.]
MQKQFKPRRLAWIETFRSRSCLDLKARWYRINDPAQQSAFADAWGQKHRPDWVERGLLVWPRGGVWLRLEQILRWPEAWRDFRSSRLRIVLHWWADQARLWVDGVLVHQGDLFDTTCRWPVPDKARSGEPLRLQLELRSPCHDDGALITSDLVLEPQCCGADPDQAQLAEALGLYLEAGGAFPESWLDLDPLSTEAAAAVALLLRDHPRPSGGMHWVGHAHLDLAWLWPVADTWQAAERTFRSALQLMDRFPQLHFAHSTPALYQWLEQHRPGLFDALRQASRAGRWEPINGPWVESDCVLVSTASLWRQFSLGQHYSKCTFPEWSHELAWLPDSFGFGAGLPAVAERTGVRWFCTHKLAWNATNPFPHRLFRWRGRNRSEVLALMLPPIGTGGNPLEILREQRRWQAATALDQALWVPGVGDHGGGPTAEMLEQLQLWEQHPQALPQKAGTVRDYLASLEAHAETLPVWRDELYLELHRACSTTRPDQKRHNRELEQCLREADLVAALLIAQGLDPHRGQGSPQQALPDWRPLLFQQFHDILPGTSIPEVFEQAQPVWHACRRVARRFRDQGLQQLLQAVFPAVEPAQFSSALQESWVWMGLQPLSRWSPLLRLPRGQWSSDQKLLPSQEAPGGSAWVQLPVQRGVTAVPLRVVPGSAGQGILSPAVRRAVQVTSLDNGQWLIANGLLEIEIGPMGVHQLRDQHRLDQLASPLQWRRFRDRGEFWDAWDLASDYRQHPLSIDWQGPPQFVESGPLVTRLVQRGRIASGSARSELRLGLKIQADCPWLELSFDVHWCQSHELLRLEIPLARQVARWASDTSGGVIERPASASTAAEQARWEVPVISWCATEAMAPGGGLAVLLNGPQGIGCGADHLGISLLRGATWPDPSADRGWHRQRLALMAAPRGWSRDAIAQAALAFREPGWLGRAPLKEPWQAMPPLPEGLVPIAMTPLEPGSLTMAVHNPGASRQCWRPGGHWRVGTAEGTATADSISLMPGELAELRLEQIP